MTPTWKTNSIYTIDPGAGNVMGAVRTAPAKKVSRDRMTEDQKTEVLGRIKATGDADDLEG